MVAGSCICPCMHAEHTAKCPEMSLVRPCERGTQWKHGTGCRLWTEKAPAERSAAWCEAPTEPRYQGSHVSLRIWITVSQEASDHTRPHGVCLELADGGEKLLWTNCPIPVGPTARKYSAPVFRLTGLHDVRHYRSKATHRGCKTPFFLAARFGASFRKYCLSSPVSLLW